MTYTAFMIWNSPKMEQHTLGLQQLIKLSKARNLQCLCPLLLWHQAFQSSRSSKIFSIFLSTPYPALHWWAEDLSDSVMHISQLIHGETSSCLLVFLTVPSKTTFPLVAYSRYYAFALFFNQLSCCRSWLYCRSQARHIAPINGCEMAYKVWK